jgi:hypothetical protein
MSINENGYWETNDYTGHAFDKKLCGIIEFILNTNSIEKLLDVGCGFAEYSRYYKSKNNNIDCDAYDGNPNTELLTEGFAKTLDFSKVVDLGKIYDCVLSLEVGEHIPKEYEQVFIDNICKHSKKIVILSWAVPGQPGWGHVNCQPNSYIIEEMQKRGFEYDKDYSNLMRNNIDSCWWFKETSMLFRKVF